MTARDAAPPAPETLRFPTEAGAAVEADLWPGGATALLLAHAEGEDRTVWRAQVPALHAAGLTLLAPDLGGTPGPPGSAPAEAMAREIAGAVAALRGRGAATVSVLGAGLGAVAAAEALLAGLVGDVHTLILLAPGPLSGPVGQFCEQAVFVSADEDEAVPVAIEQRMLAPGNVQLTVFTGNFDARGLFASPHAGRLMRLILESLPDPAG